MRFFGVNSLTTGFGEFHLITKLVRFIEDYKVGTKFVEKNFGTRDFGLGRIFTSSLGL